MEGQTMRDWRRDATYYDQRIHFDEVVLPSFQQSSAEALLPLEKRTMRNRFVASSTISWTNHTTLEWLYRYSRGEDISSLRSGLFCVLATFTESRHRLSLLPTAELGGDTAQLVDSGFALPDYTRVLRLVSLGVCLGVGPVWVEAVVGAWPGSPGGHDRLLDRLVASAVSDRQIGTVDAAKRPAYGLLASAFETEDSDEQVAIITKYLDGWYKQCRGFGWWNTHTLGDKQGSSEYFGYWCFEAAAVISALGLEVDRFDSEYLPKDLAAWCSQHPDLIGTGPSPDEVDLDSVIGPGPTA